MMTTTTGDPALSHCGPRVQVLILIYYSETQLWTRQRVSGCGTAANRNDRSLRRSPGVRPGFLGPVEAPVIRSIWRELQDGTDGRQGNRARHDCSKLRYPSGPTDMEWAPIESLIPPVKRCGWTGATGLEVAWWSSNHEPGGAVASIARTCGWSAAPSCCHYRGGVRATGPPVLRWPASFRSVECRSALQTFRPDDLGRSYHYPPPRIDNSTKQFQQRNLHLRKR